MSKIRINELARQLEVKSREVIDKLHELGIAEKITHSSSIDEDKADQLRRYYSGESHAPLPAASQRNGSGAAVEEHDAEAPARPRPEKKPRLTQALPPEVSAAPAVADAKVEPALAPSPGLADAEKTEDENKP